ncbi:MAG: M23 family metallopeptidase [Holosporales bacterium]
MGRVGLRVLALMLLLGAAPAQAAEAVTLSGVLAQGSVALGQTEPGAAVRLGDIPVPVSPDGRFVLGFAYNAPETAVLSVRLPDGKTETQTLEIARTAYDIQRIDGLPTAKVSPNPADTKRIQDDQARIRGERQEALAQPSFPRLGFILPAEGRRSGVFGSQRILNGQPRQPHFGIDIAAPVGTPFVSPADGVVRVASKDFFLLGGTIMVDHGYGMTSVFAHCEDVLVKEGQRVQRGEQLGTIGNTGRSTGAHLHWGTAVGGINVDPAVVLETLRP